MWALTDHWTLSIFTKILVAKLSPLQELLVQQQPPSSSALSPASNSCQARTRNITFPGRTMHQHRLGGEQRLAQVNPFSGSVAFSTPLFERI
ncbi:hypothetical protein LB507_001692 [Fusarium sp. FIESC RH6]|nr:hypothetical protein LB507_001692 [Fusarium sp. FIESC RH6]